MALRGHDETEASNNPGNFRAILQLLSLESIATDEVFEQFPKNARYISNDSQ